MPAHEALRGRSAGSGCELNSLRTNSDQQMYLYIIVQNFSFIEIDTILQISSLGEHADPRAVKDMVYRYGRKTYKAF